MQVDITKALELILAVSALIGIIWRIFSNFERIDRRLELHIQATLNQDEKQNLLVNQVNEKIDHKFRRIAAALDDIHGYLEKQGNYKRRHFYSRESSEDKE